MSEQPLRHIEVSSIIGCFRRVPWLLKDGNDRSLPVRTVLRSCGSGHVTSRRMARLFCGEPLTNSDSPGDDGPAPHDGLRRPRRLLGRRWIANSSYSDTFNDRPCFMSTTEFAPSRKPRSAILIPIAILMAESFLWAFALVIPIWLLRQGASVIDRG